MVRVRAAGLVRRVATLAVVAVFALSLAGNAAALDGGRGGLRVEVFGELTRAERVAVIVPGTDVDATHFEGPSQPAGMARALRAQARNLYPGVRLVVVAWAGYHTPHGIGLGEVTGARAAAGARRLDAYLRDLAHRTAAPVTLLCHSYGTVVCGLTPPRPQVTDVVALGSPGMRIHDAGDLAPVHVWAARDRGDRIGAVPNVRVLDLGHGPDPVDPAFGARVIETGRARGHSGYFTPRTAALRNLARIATGHPARVTCAMGRACHHDGV